MTKIKLIAANELTESVSSLGVDYEIIIDDAVEVDINNARNLIQNASSELNVIGLHIPMPITKLTPIGVGSMCGIEMCFLYVTPKSCTLEVHRRSPKPTLKWILSENPVYKSIKD